MTEYDDIIVYFHDLVVYKKAFDISRKGSLSNMTPTIRHEVIIFHFTGCIYILLYSFKYLNIIIYYSSYNY